MKATPEQWNEAGSFASDTRACLLELRARVETLEREAASAEAQPAPADLLVERVADAIVAKATSAGIVDDRPARAAIREVAEWLYCKGIWEASDLLKREVRR